MSTTEVPSLSLLVAIQAYFWNHYLQKINMKVFVSTAQAFLASTLKIMLLFQELHKDPSEKVRTAYRCTFQNSMKRGIKISPNTLSFKKLFPTELIGNLQRITLLVCPSQICRQTKEESFEQCAALLGEFSRAVDALDATGTGEFSVPYMLSTGEEALLLRTESLSSGQKVFQEQRGCVSPGECPPGTAQGNGGGKFSPPEILFGKPRMSGPARGTAAGSSVQLRLLDETFPETEQDHFPGERRQGRSVHIVTRLTGDSSLSCHSSMVTACTASASKANTQALIKFALILLAEFSPAWAPRELGTYSAACRISPVSAFSGTPSSVFLLLCPVPIQG
ncbi:uncharacterized protein LOC115352937 isoform X1 [Aquila chrysaetos chrysaetos]|uniref:uncharacterized protein LOC115352937 isoform X1 n=1 Tax=Aquila chrysaetos chrysaetos TaxID=223781 RepID=UPI001176F306|nr:uncharacterized protein LOC115352937 isoform X1 [Aquila chrysaetos chrysaetos]